jgi:hypothetical protein
MRSFKDYNTYRNEFDGLMEVLVFEQELCEYKKTHPGKGISDKKKSEVVKRAKRGENVFGGGFEKIEKSAKKRYGSEEAGKRVAAAVMWKKVKGKHMTKEDIDDLLWIVEDDIEIIMDHAINEQEVVLNEKNWIQSAHLKKGRCTPAPNPDCPKGSRQYALAQRFKKGDLHKD